MKRLVIERNILDYKYFMDEAQLYEIVILDNMINYADRLAFERMRMIVWSNFKSTGCKVPKPEKLMPFSTDNDDVEVLERDELNEIGKHLKKMFSTKKDKNI